MSLDQNSDEYENASEDEDYSKPNSTHNNQIDDAEMKKLRRLAKNRYF